ncbi:hypothetical protein BK673_22195 [Pseudomonas fluorescens]|uniref:Uncharacterized protein n=1 Tax=Pseudomonas fluorescens TaxID=294 RepID=A0A423P1K5_PSEFL|nr:hypothetical protein BOW65_05195 [Pseudomonas koreensis]ROO04967.1 hypothetical protein BK673_22195 [Pseudomonas fluorescens]
MPLDGHPQPVGAGPAGGSGAGACLLATDGATPAEPPVEPVVVVVVVPFAWRRITVVLLDEEGEELLLLTTAVGVEPVRPSKRIV